MTEVICKKEIELLDEKYVVYLKRVPVQIASGGMPLKTAVKAYVKKVQ